MSGKTAKYLRRMAGYKMKKHPRESRKYTSMNEKKYDTGKKDGDGKKIIIDVRSYELQASDPRVLYKELKKEYKQFGFIHE